MSKSSCPHPSAELGMSGSPMSSAPFIRIALIKSDLGSVINWDSRRYCLTIVAAPAATGVAMDEPSRVM